MTTLRRAVLLVAVMFWQGGFMFYGAVVVPVGAKVLGSDREQGFITRTVTDYLNLVGAAALAAWGWDVAAQPGDRRRWLLWAALAGLMAVLGVLHLRMDRLLDPDELRVLDRAAFRRLHQAYLTVSTVQWAGALLLLGWTMRTWMRPAAAVTPGSRSR